MTLSGMGRAIALCDVLRVFGRLSRLAMLGLAASASFVAQAETSVSGDISTNTTWMAAQGPYVVSSDVVIRNNAKLTIEAGVTVYMAPSTGVTVQSGSVLALGTAQHPIRVTSQKLQSGQTAVPGDWNQWVFGSGTVDTRLENIIIEYGKGVAVRASSPVLNWLNLKNHQGAAITLDLAASPSGVGNQASGNTLNAVVVPSGEIAGTVSWGIKGIPYVVESGTLSVGVAPRLDVISPKAMQQGETIELTLTGSRLSGLSKVEFDKSGITATVLPGGTATTAKLAVTSSLDTPTGSTSLKLMTDAGEIALADALTIVQQQPKLTAVTPSRLYVGQGAVEVELAGMNLTNQSTVMLNGTSITSSYSSATAIRATIPNQTSTGQLAVKLNTPDPIHVGQTLTSNEIQISVDQPQLTLAPATATIKSGATQVLTLALPHPAPSGGFVVDLASGLLPVVTVPQSVFVAENETTANFEAKGVGAGSATITASHPGWLSAKTKLSVLSSSLPQLLAEYRLDESVWAGVSREVKDSTANANDGTGINGATVRSAKLCSGGYFEGSSYSRVSLPVSLQDLAVNTFTMMLWVKPGKTHEIDAESSTSTTGTVGQNYALCPSLNRNKWDWDTSGYAGSGVSVGTNGISVYEHAGSYMPPVLVWAGTLPSDDWTHIAVTYSNGIPALYVNGVFKKVGRKGDHANVLPSFTIGSSFYGSALLAADEYKLFGGALSAADIATVYNNENAGMNWDGSARICGQ